MDWWSKFYASIGDVDKAGPYLEKGYDKVMVGYTSSTRKKTAKYWCETAECESHVRHFLSLNELFSMRNAGDAKFILKR